MNYFATEYTIHFDDTMAYGSHHFLTAFKLQCAARESFLFGEKIYDLPGVPQALDGLHLLTADAYARNLHPARLGERLAILLTIEEWHRASARFCYRAIRADGQPICAGFQTLIGVDANSGLPTPLPDPLWRAMEAMRAIEEPALEKSFRDRVLTGGANIETLFGQAERDAAISFLNERYPGPQVIGFQPEQSPTSVSLPTENRVPNTESIENSAPVWVFAGQGALDISLLCRRLSTYRQLHVAADELKQVAHYVSQKLGGDAHALVGGVESDCRQAIENTPSLSQVAIHLQNVLEAKADQHQGRDASVLMGHSFGEIAAFELAGSFDLLTGVQIVCERVLAIAQHAPADGSLLVVSEDRYRVATELGLAEVKQVLIAGRNHDRQTVLSGSREELEKLTRYFLQRDIPCARVPTPTSFHHPQLRQAAQQWAQRIGQLNLKAPTRPLYSPNGRRFISATDDIATTLAHQLLRPFDLKGAVDDLVALGATHFIDYGSTGSLARILSKSGAVVVTRAADNAPVGQPQINGSSDGITAELLRQPAGQPTQSADYEINGSKPNGFAASGHGATARDQAQPQADRHVATPIAIVGQGCLLPGNANSPEQLYRAISEQRNGIVDQRQSDADWAEDFYSEKLVPDRSTSSLMGRVNDAQIVCPTGVDPVAFAKFSRTQRLLCIALAPCVQSLRDAKKIMCFVGATADGFEDHDIVTSLEYAGIDPCDPEIDRILNTRASSDRGPHAAIQEVIDVLVRPGIEAVLVDAACASSLYTAALGMQALETGRADAVIAGGVFCPGPGNSCLFSQFQGTTSTGCRPFDASSDGVVFSEGAAVLTLRRLDDAVELGNPITGILRGFGLSSDGRSSSANVPQTEGQLLSLRRCYSDYDIDQGSISAIEAHGTSTPVGDATELKTLNRFYRGVTDRAIPIHSLKGLLGHTGWAAGTTSLIAACQYLKNGVFPAQANFQNPCEALVDANDALSISQDARALPPRARVAVDGFGFGGANAHLVVEKFEGSQAAEDLSAGGSPRPRAKSANRSADDELVVVAYHQLEPEQGDRFNRNHKLSDKHILLPDLVDDMDITQGLAVSLADGVLANLPDISPEVQEATGMVLALCGKTARGIEATARILTPRLKRLLGGSGQMLEKLQTAMDLSNPSGPYTLQCMMPNVASGRAALQMNLKGPNFVVDAGNHSLEAAIDSARLLLDQRNPNEQLCIVAAIQAGGRSDKSAAKEQEFASAFLVTTRRKAADLGLETISTIDQIKKSLGEHSQSTAAKVQHAMRMLQGGDEPLVRPAAAAARPAGRVDHDAVEPATHTIHTPVWVEAEAEKNIAGQLASPARLVVVLADARHADAWNSELSRRGIAFKLVIAGRDLASPSGQVKDTCVFDLSDPRSVQAGLDEVAAFKADVVIGFEAPPSWDLKSSLELAADHPLGELMFLLAQRLEARARQSDVEFWGLFLDSFGDVEHPLTGSTAGVLKSIRRELNTHLGSIVCCRGLSLSAALGRLFEERSCGADEPEVVFDDSSRWIRRLQPVVLSTQTSSQRVLDRDSVVVATGGAQGVTAVLMESLLKRYQCTVVAIGRSKPEAGPAEQTDWEGLFYEDYIRKNPKAGGVEMKLAYQRTRRSWETHRTIQRLQSLGGRFEYCSADVTCSDQVDQVMQQIGSKFGKIDLLVHGAGVQLSKQLKDRSLEEFRRTFAVKVGGLKNLVTSSLRTLGQIPAVHALTSAFSIFGNDGQHDYGAANETLDRLCNLGNSQNRNWSSIAWLAWDGIGMTRGSEYQALAEQRGLSALTAESGAPFFHQVIEQESTAAINVPLSDQERLNYAVDTIPAASDSPGRILESRFAIDQVRWLQHHRVRGVPTVPGAWILNQLAQVASKVAPAAGAMSVVTAEDIAFRRFVRVHESDETPRFVAIQQADEVQAWLLTDLRHPSGTLLAKDVVLAEARFRFHSQIDSVAALNGSPTVARNGAVLRDPYCSSDSELVELSGPFDCLHEIEIYQSGRQARFAQQACCDLPDVQQVPELLLDAAWRVGAMYAQPDNQDLFVPVQIERITMPFVSAKGLQSLTDCTIVSTAPQVQEDSAHWQRSEVRDSNGQLRLIVENAIAKKMA